MTLLPAHPHPCSPSLRRGGARVWCSLMELTSVDTGPSVPSGRSMFPPPSCKEESTRYHRLGLNFNYFVLSMQKLFNFVLSIVSSILDTALMVKDAFIFVFQVMIFETQKPRSPQSLAFRDSPNLSTIPASNEDTHLWF